LLRRAYDATEQILPAPQTRLLRLGNHQEG
jgi:hypothetical protein